MSPKIHAKRYIYLAICSLLVLHWSMPCAADDVLHVGAATKVITPNPLLPVSGGMGPTAPVSDKRGELTARAMVLSRGDTTIGMVSVDVLGFPGVLAKRVAALVPQIAAENIVIGASHTHSAPDVYAFPDGRGGHTGDLQYIDFVCQQAANALIAAHESLRPASLRIATGEANGKIAYNYYAPDLYDRRVGIIQAIDEKGSTICTLVNYAIHPEVLGNRVGLLSPDLIGPLCDEIEDKAGGVALYFNGAQGGMVTADNRNLQDPSNPLRGYWNDERSWDECLRIGQTLASESLRIINDAEPLSNPKLKNHWVDAVFPVDSDELWAVVTRSPLKYPHRQDRTITTRINLLEIGDAQVLTIPGEALPNIGFYLKRKITAKHAFLFGLTNDAFGYIMTEVDFNSFPRYQYISRVSLGEKTGTILIDHCLKLVSESQAATE